MMSSGSPGGSEGGSGGGCGATPGVAGFRGGDLERCLRILIDGGSGG